MDSYRGRSNDRERSRYSPPARDRYVPSDRASRPRSRSPNRYRPRSRSPPRMDSWRSERPRSPPRRYEPRGDAYPPRDTRPRSPPPHRATRDYIPADDRYDGRRARSPPAGLKRARESSPAGRSVRSPPPPIKRERLDSPAREYRARSPPRRPYSPPRDSRRSPPPRSDINYRPRTRSPPRREEVNPYEANSWRRRSRSPRPIKAESVAGSRRSSPRPYPTRPDRYDDRPMPPRPRSPVRARSPMSASVSRRGSPPPRPSSSVREERDPYGRATADSRAAYNYGERDSMPAPSAPANQDRAPPTGPSSNRYAALAESPSQGPPSAPLSMSAHNRPGSAAPPTYPRGGGGYRGRGGAMPSRDYPPRDYLPRGGFSASYGRGGGGGGAPYDRPPTREGYQSRESYDSRGPPPGPRPREYPSSSSGSASAFAAPPMFRSSNSTSTTYPRTQRFNTHLADIAQIKPEGQKMPALVDPAKAEKLEEEALKLRKLIDEKQSRKRGALKEWERLENDVKTASLRSELADEHLRALSGESSDGMAAAAF